MRQRLRALSAAFCIIAFSSAPAMSEEGMWTFDHFPTARMQQQMGWAPDQAWLDRAMAGTARLPGCSASNVSAQGLVMTNHHCVIACVTALSSTEHNYITDGFMAATREEETRCPNMNVQVLTGITDITDRINAATADVAPEGFAHARDAEMARLEGECTNPPSVCEVVTLYQGGRYALYRYKRYDDVRLVFAPEHQMAAFGGDADNFNFPRYDIDFSFIRLYENGAPAATPAHLTMRFTPLTENEIVLIAGNPGRTSRQRSTAELTFERDLNLPWQIENLTAVRAQIAAYSAQGPDQERIASSALQSVENALKGLTGRRQALQDPAGFARVASAEQDLQTRVHRNLAAQREVGDAWGEIATAETAYRAIFYRYQYLEARAGERSMLFGWARDIVRGAAERPKPDAERVPRFSDARLNSVTAGLRAQRPVTPEFEELMLSFWLTKLRERLPASDPRSQRIFHGLTPPVLAHQLAQSRLGDAAYRMQLWDGGAAAVAASDDPMIQFVRAWDDDARTIRTRYIETIESPIARAQERIAQARFRAFGEDRYPDATFTPRVSYGRVEGWADPQHGQVPWSTNVAGLYAHATGQAPYALTQRWIDARASLDPNTIFDVSTSTDVIGGNSGSPLLDQQGRVVGAIFDGNIHSLGGEYFYDGTLNRSVTVANTVIEAALAHVYHADALLAELQAH